MKAILLPTDFSKNSINAINYAMELFKDEVCNFYIMNVQKSSSFISDDMMVVSSTTTIYSTLIDAAKKSISNIITAVEKNKRNNNHRFHSIVDYDNFIDSINQAVEKYDIDLIVMGTKGASGISKILFGSNTVRVLRHTEIPLLVIPDNCKFKELTNIGFITNHITLYNNDTLKVLKDLVRFTMSDLTIMHLTDDKDSKEYRHNRTFFDLYFEKAIHKNIKVDGENILKEIRKHKLYKHIEMLAIVKKHHTFFEHLFNDFTEEEIAYSGKLPLLILNKEAL